MIVTSVTYGEGGYDPDAPDHNVVNVEQVEVPDPQPEPLPTPTEFIAQVEAMTEAQKADLRAALGL